MSMGNAWAQPGAPQQMPVVQPKKAGPGGIIAGVVLMVLGIVIGVVLIVTSTVGTVGSVTSATAHQADGMSFGQNLTSGQQMGIWISANGSGSCQITDPAGNLVTLNTDISAAQTVNGYQLVGTFDTATSGVYSIACLASGDMFQYKVASPISASGLALGIIGGIAVIFVLGLVGLIVLIVSLVKRSKRNKAAALPPAYMPPQYPESQPQYPPAQTAVPQYAPEQVPPNPQTQFPQHAQ